MLAPFPVSARTVVATIAVALLLSVPAVIAAQADDNDANTRLDRVEAQMRTLTGQIEDLTHQLQVLQDELTKLEQDNELRFSDLENKGGAGPGGGATAPAAAAAAASTATATQATTPPQPPAAQPLTPAQVAIAQSKQTNDGIAALAAGGQQLGAPPAPLGTLTVQGPPSGGQPIDLSTLAGGGDDGNANQQQAALQPPPPPAATAAPAAPAGTAAGAQVAALAPTGNPQADYDTAYRLITAGRYDVAETAFRQFLAAYPTDAQAPDAQYWLGESLYSRGDYRGAGQQFQAVFQKYPKSKRAPDALLKLGLSLAGLGQTGDACKMYALDLKQYPTMSNALRQRVVTEQASASC
jgi:tol-pal system protein YbgF